MQIKVDRDKIRIIIEQQTLHSDYNQHNIELAFIEEVLGLKNHGDFVFLKRINDYPESTIINCLRTEKPREKIESIEYVDGSIDLFLDLPDNLLEYLRKEASSQRTTVDKLICDIITKEVEKNA